MAIPKDKVELLEAVQKESRKLREELAKFPSKAARKNIVEGQVSVADLLAYQVGWGECLLSWHYDGGAMPAKNFKWNQLGDLAKHFYQKHKADSYSQLLKKFDNVVEKVTALVESQNNTQLYTIGIYEWCGQKWPMGRWINVNTSSPYRSARLKVRKARIFLENK